MDSPPVARHSLFLVAVSLVSGWAGFFLGTHQAQPSPAFRDAPESHALPEPARTQPPPGTPEPAPRAPVEPEAVRRGNDVSLELFGGRLEVISRDGQYALIPDGPWREMREDGTLAAQGHYEQGAKVGVWTTFHANGSIESLATYEKGGIQGLLERWHPGGARAEVKSFVGGVAEGTSSTWYANGRIESEGRWTGGEKDGVWTAYDAQGRLVRRERWEGGVLAQPVEMWDPDGVFPSPEEALERARVGGKYATVIAQIAAPQDRGSYREFFDYGRYPATDYGGHRDIGEGYWVYVYPYWLVWRDLVSE